MSLFGGVEIVGRPHPENLARLDRLPIPMIRRAHRVGIAIDKDWFAALESKFNRLADAEEKDILDCIPADKLAEFQAGADAIEGVEKEDEKPKRRKVRYDDDGNEVVPDERSWQFNANSAEQIGTLLFDVLGLGKDKRLKKTTAGRISTGKRQLELIRPEHPIVGKVLRYRELRKLVTTYCRNIPKLAKFHPRGGCCPVCELAHATDQWRVHGRMGTTRAETGRINHTDPNLGNIPTRTEDGQDVQRGFIAPPGHRLVIRDLKQIELCDLAHLSKCQSMIDVIWAGGDLHTDTCWRTGLTPQGQKPSVAERMGAKRVNFGLQNGSTEKGLYLQLVMDFSSKNEPVPSWLTESWCKGFIADTLRARPEIQTFFETCWYRGRRYGVAWDIFGRIRPVPELKSTHSWIREGGLRLCQNLPVTSTAAGQLKLCMGKGEKVLGELRDDGIWAESLLTVHDSMVVECDERYAEGVDDVLAAVFDNCMTDEQTGELRFRVPIKSDGLIAERWEK